MSAIVPNNLAATSPRPQSYPTNQLLSPSRWANLRFYYGDGNAPNTPTILQTVRFTSFHRLIKLQVHWSVKTVAGPRIWLKRVSPRCLASNPGAIFLNCFRQGHI